MSGKGWTEDEAATLRSLAGKVPIAELAHRIGRTVPAVRRQAVNLGLHVGLARLVRWTTQEDARLRKRWRGDNAADLARVFGRTPSSVKNRARVLGLPTCRPRRLNPIEEAES